MTGSSFYSVEKMVDGRSGGTTQAETRIYNERLILTLIRRHGQLSKTNLTQLTGLSPQTITTLVNRAAENQLLVRREPVRGGLGQPSVPYALNPDAAYSFGLKVDRRTADVAMINFVGEMIGFERINFDYPSPTEIMTFVKSAVGKLRRRQRTAVDVPIAGLGIASPFYQWNWNDEKTAAAGPMQAWKEVDIRAELDADFDWPVFLFNDATVSAAAELMFGVGTMTADYIYAYIGYYLGGGIVLDHHLFPGRNRLAGALGNVPVPSMDGRVQLKDVASLQTLENKMHGDDSGWIWSSPDDWGARSPQVSEWIEEVSAGLACATEAAAALLDIDNLVLDGAIPASVRKEIARATRRKLGRALAERPEPFSVLEGKYGHLAPAIGGASVPFLINYSNDKELLFKE